METDFLEKLIQSTRLKKEKTELYAFSTENKCNETDPYALLCWVSIYLGK